jgi:hypothetical protein
MMIVCGLDDLHRLARRFHRSREVATLTLKVWGVPGG